MGVSTEGAVVPGTLQNMMDAFNKLNTAIQALLTNGDQVATDVSSKFLPHSHN